MSNALNSTCASLSKGFPCNNPLSSVTEDDTANLELIDDEIIAMIQETEEEENDYQAIENVEEQISGTQAHSRTAEISQNDGDSPDYHQFAASFRLVQHNYMALHCLLHQQSSCFISQYLSSHYVHVTERPEGSELSKAPYSGMALCSTWLLFFQL
ncbi:hypothetical protein Plhal304r1_c086g0169181 [Plasmopara halstedii]